MMQRWKEKIDAARNSEDLKNIVMNIVWKFKARDLMDDIEAGKSYQEIADEIIDRDPELSEILFAAAMKQVDFIS